MPHQEHRLPEHNTKVQTNAQIAVTTKRPTAIKQLDGFRDFKRELKLFILAHPFYLFNAFFTFKQDSRTSK